jgi:hypothetical protein
MNRSPRRTLSGAGRRPTGQLSHHSTRSRRMHLRGGVYTAEDYETYESASRWVRAFILLRATLILRRENLINKLQSTWNTMTSSVPNVTAYDDVVSQAFASAAVQENDDKAAIVSNLRSIALLLHDVFDNLDHAFDMIIQDRFPDLTEVVERTLEEKWADYALMLAEQLEQFKGGRDTIISSTIPESLTDDVVEICMDKMIHAIVPLLTSIAIPRARAFFARDRRQHTAERLGAMSVEELARLERQMLASVRIVTNAHPWSEDQMMTLLDTEFQDVVGSEFTHAIKEIAPKIEDDDDEDEDEDEGAHHDEDDSEQITIVEQILDMKSRSDAYNKAEIDILRRIIAQRPLEPRLRAKIAEISESKPRIQRERVEARLDDEAWLTQALARAADIDDRQSIIDDTAAFVREKISTINNADVRDRILRDYHRKLNELSSDADLRDRILEKHINLIANKVVNLGLRS